MTGRTHAAIGAAVTAALVVPATGWEGLVLVPIGAGAALLPDLDSPDSRLGHWIPAWIHREHRGPMHSVAAVAGWALLAWALAGGLLHVGWAAAFVAAVVLGVGSHLVADLPHRQGQQLLWPLSRDRFGLYVIRESSWFGRHLEGLAAGISTALVWGAIWTWAVHPGLDRVGLAIHHVFGL